VFGGTASQTFTLTGATDKYNGDINDQQVKRDRDARLGMVMDAGQNIDRHVGNSDLNGKHLSVDGTLSQSGGIFSGASGAIDIDYELISQVETFTSTSGTLTLGGNFYVSNSPTFNSQQRPVTFDGSSNTTADVNSTFTFNNLTNQQSGMPPYRWRQRHIDRNGGNEFRMGNHDRRFVCYRSTRQRHGGLDLRCGRLELVLARGNPNIYVDERTDKYDGHHNQQSSGTVTLAFGAGHGGPEPRL